MAVLHQNGQKRPAPYAWKELCASPAHEGTGSLVETGSSCLGVVKRPFWSNFDFTKLAEKIEKLPGWLRIDMGGKKRHKPGGLQPSKKIGILVLNKKALNRISRNPPQVEASQGSLFWPVGRIPSGDGFYLGVSNSRNKNTFATSSDKKKTQFFVSKKY